MPGTLRLCRRIFLKIFSIIYFIWCMNIVMDQMFVCWSYDNVYGIWKWSLLEGIRFRWSLESREIQWGLFLFKEMRTRNFSFSALRDTERRHLSTSQKRDFIKNKICWNFYPRLPNLPNSSRKICLSVTKLCLTVMRPWTAALRLPCLAEFTATHVH